MTYTYDSSTIFDVTYTRDAGARVESFVETIDSVTREVEYGYDLAGRLETVTIDSVLAATYEYDENGNRTAVITSGTISATYDDQDRLLTFGDFEYEYTAAGELVSRTDTITTDVTLYDYDVVGNLRSVELPDSTLIEYVTDARGRRVGKSIDGVPDRGWLYSGNLRIVAELDDVGALVSRFVYGGEPANAPIYMVRGGTTYRLVTDQLGSVRLVVDVATGTVAQRLDYDPWGVVLTDTNPGFQPFGFAGGLYDPDTGLVRFGARDYDAEVGRWTSKDPILFNGGDENLFGYCTSDPVNFIDETGNNPVAGAAAAVAACLASTPCALILSALTVAAMQQAAILWCCNVGNCCPNGRSNAEPARRRPRSKPDDEPTKCYEWPANGPNHPPPGGPLAPLGDSYPPPVPLPAPNKPRGGPRDACIDACESGGEALESFCRSLKDARLRAICWSKVFVPPQECRNWCYWAF